MGKSKRNSPKPDSNRAQRLAERRAAQQEAAAHTHLDPQVLNGTNNLRLAVYGNDTHGQVLLTAVFDNLGKGASGAAVQNLDLMLAAMA